MPERVLLSSIRTLTLYANKYTRARRTAPVPQLECSGSYCRDFQPAAVQCTNSGGSNVDIDWKCEADLPSSLRFGNLQVSCEGWDRPGDPYVLQGSCGLSYSLIRIRDNGESSTDYATYAFYIAFLLLALYLLINWLIPRSYNRPSTHGGTGSSWGGGGTGQGWGWGGRGGGPTSSNNAPPPPYTKYPSSNSDRSWTPGFWTGLGVGGLAAGIYNRMNQPTDPVYRTRPTWDWERSATGTGPYRPEASAARRRDWGHGDSSSWGAGSSTGSGTNLGEMRRATGYGGTSVR